MKTTKVCIENYLALIEKGVIKSNIVKVLNHFKFYGTSNCEDVEIRLLMKHQTASATITNLLDMGVLEPVSRIRTSSGSLANELKFVEDPNQWIINAQIRKREKYQKWMDSGKKNFGVSFTDHQLKMFAS